MRCCLALLPLVFVLTSAHAQPVPGARSVIKQVYTLVSPSDAESPSVGALTRTEYETYGTDGRRLRVEWRDAQNAVTLTFMEVYADADRPHGAIYFEGADLEPYLERNEYLEAGRLKRVTYLRADSTVTGINEFVLDDAGNELERRYGTATGVIRAVDTVAYDSTGTQTGYVYARLDGSRTNTYTYVVQSKDTRGTWTSRIVRRDGEPRLLETRTITYAD